MARRTTRNVALGPARKPAQAVQAVEEIEVKPEDLELIEAPSAYATTINVQGTGNDFTLLFSRPWPARDKSGAIANLAKIQITSMVTMSPQTAKDLVKLLGDAVQKHEEEYGEIKTSYLMRIENGKPTKGR